MLGTYFVITPITWVFFIAGRLLETEVISGYQLSSFIFLPWAIAWIGNGIMILKKGFWFEVLNWLLLVAFVSLPLWLNDKAQSLALIFLISFFGFLLQVGTLLSRRARREPPAAKHFISRLSSSNTNGVGEHPRPT